MPFVIKYRPGITEFDGKMRSNAEIAASLIDSLTNGCSVTIPILDPETWDIVYIPPGAIILIDGAGI